MTNSRTSAPENNHAAGDMKKLLITSALPYANGPIHIGHLVEYIQSDIWSRYWRLRGRNVLYVCADDTHGTPIMLRARQEGIAPESLIQRIGAEHRRDFSAFQIHFDHYHSTHSDENRALATEIYEKLREGGHIVARAVKQARCPSCNMFLPDRYVRGQCPRCGAVEQYGDSCEVCSATYQPAQLVSPHCGQCGALPEWRDSEHLFFRIADFERELRAWLPGRMQKEVLNKLDEWFEQGLHDWDISRDAPYFGFEIPGAPGKYFYVWLDAPVGYIASTLAWAHMTGGDFDSYWRREESELCHFIGKDIVYFHALFWPAMLMGGGFRTPSRLCVHGFLTVNGEKMSKSRGTFITAADYLAHLDPQYLRYYYAAKLGPKVEDIDLNLDDFRLRVDAELVNRITNIPSRVLTILTRNHGGRLGRLDDSGNALRLRARGRCEEVGRHYAALEFARATAVINEVANDINAYLDERKPWKLGATDPAAAAAACTATLNAFRIVATLMAPVLPTFAGKFAYLMGLDSLRWQDLDEVLEERPVRPYEHLVSRVDPNAVAALVRKD